MIFGVKQLKKIDDWIDVVSRKNWVPSRSAFELAHKWHNTLQFPERVAQVLCTSAEPSLRDLHREYAIVEMPTFLDTQKGPSWTDIMVYARNATGDPVVIGVEGKADELFDEEVRHWVRDSRQLERQPKTSRLNRLDYLSRILRITVGSDSELRYQLLHRTAATVLEAEKIVARSAIVLVHSFDDSDAQNWNDYVSFLNYLGIQHPEKMKLSGPVPLGAGVTLTTFFGWVWDERT
jgi:hypothetical protein